MVDLARHTHRYSGKADSRPSTSYFPPLAEELSYDGRGHKHRGSTANTFHAVLARNGSHCHLADSDFNTNILLSHAFCPSLCMYGLVTKKIASACIDTSSLMQQCHAPRLVALLLSRNLKPRKLIVRAFSDFPRKLDPMKITRHMV